MSERLINMHLLSYVNKGGLCRRMTVMLCCVFYWVGWQPVLGNLTGSARENMRMALYQFTCPNDIKEYTPDCNIVVNNIGLQGVNESDKDKVSYVLTGATIGLGNRDASGNTFNIGMTTVTYSYEGIVVCSFTVEVLDTQNPTITCPASIFALEADAGQCFKTYALPDPTVNDNCGIDKIEVEVTDPGTGTPSTPVVWNSGDTYNFLVGTTLVSYTVTDLSGNSASCSFSVEVLDKQKPIITCPADITGLEAEPDECFKNYTLPDPTDNDDNCGVAKVEFTVTDPGAEAPTSPVELTGTESYHFKVGISTVTYIVADKSGNSDECTFTVEVLDTQDPIITCPADITGLEAESGECYKNYTLPAPTDNDDNCAVAKVEFTVTDPGAGSPTSPVILTGVKSYNFKVGTSTVTYIVADKSGNSDECTFTVEVLDKQKPTIECPGDIAGLVAESGECYRNYTLPAPTDTDDNCAVAKVEFTVTDPGTSSPTTPVVLTGAESYNFLVGTSTVTYIVTDKSGNSDECTFTVEVLDTQDPTITCPGDIAGLEAELDECFKNYTLPLPLAIDDNCAVAKVEFTVTDPGAGAATSPVVLTGAESYDFMVGVSTVTYIVTDKSGNTAECTFTVEVLDTQDPTITCPGNITGLEAETGKCVKNYTLPFPVPTNDNCGVAKVEFTVTDPGAGAATSPVVLTGAESYEFKVGVSTVTYIVTDKSGNTAECTFTVEVLDTQDPTITCPADIIIPAEQNRCDVVITGITPITNDNCGVERIQYTLSGATVGTGFNDASGLRFNLGITSVTYEVFDKAGNSASCGFTIIVKDEQVPTAICKDFTVKLGALSGTGTVTPQDIDNGSWDYCTPQTDLDLKLIGQTSFDCTDIGIPYEITLVVTDTSGNVSTCTADITVEYYQAPVPEVNPQTSELCNAGTTALIPQNVGFENVTSWKWTATPQSADITGASNGSSSNYVHSIEQALTNISNNAQKVEYVITPTVYKKCALSPVYAIVWVNPTPDLIVPVDTLICNNGHTLIPIETGSTTSDNATVYYSWTDGGNSEGDRPVGSYINQPLNNPNDWPIDVNYSMTASLYVDGNKCPIDRGGFTSKVVVEPTPKMSAVTVEDNVSGDKIVDGTVCNNSTYNLQVSKGNSGLNNGESWYFIHDRSSNITVSGDNISDQPGDFSQTVNNSALAKQDLTYAFEPRIKVRHGRECRSNSFNLLVTVNPTPEISRQFFRNNKDSICYHDGTELRLESNNGSITGTLNYNLSGVNYSSGKVDNVASVGTSAFSDGSPKRASIDQTTLVNVSDEVQPVTYSLSPFITYQQLTCQGTQTQSILYIAPELKFDMVDKKVNGGYNISCYGFRDGRIDAEDVQGGWVDNGYSYDWSNTDDRTHSYIDHLEAATYEVRVIDKTHGCISAPQTKTLTQPAKLKVTAVTESLTCNGPTGSITLNTQGGTPAYNYDIWKGPNGYNYDGPNSSFDNLISGIYSIKITDVNACLKDTAIIVNYYNGSTEVPQITWNETNYGTINGLNQNISCNGANDGSMIPMFDMDPTVEYTLSYQDGQVIKNGTVTGGMLGQINNLVPGTYTLSVTDDQGCEYNSSTTLREPPPITFKTSIHQYDNGYEVQCYGTATGQVSISDVSGGYGNSYGPYEYKWIPDNKGAIQNVPNQTALYAGDFQVQVLTKRLNGYCSGTSTFTLRQPPELVIQSTIPQYNGYEIACHGQNSGEIDIDITGSKTYTVLWARQGGSMNYPQAEDQHNLPADTYTLTATYGGGCTVERTYVLKQPDEISAQEALSPIKCNGDRNGAIEITTVSGGTGSYTYRWQSPNTTITNPGEKNQSGLGPGTYWLVITDANSCVRTETFVLTEPNHIVANIKAEDPTCSPGGDGYITLNPEGGTPGYTYLWSYNGRTDKDISGLSPGDYSVTITDANGCTEVANATIKQPVDLMVNAIVTSNYNGYNIDCFGKKTGKVTFDIQHGRQPYTYQWVSGSTPVNVDTTRVAAGTYLVTVIDKFNCRGSDDVVLTQPSKVRVLAATKDITCPGGDNGNMQVFVSGGISPYTYDWSNGEHTYMVGKVKAGRYSVRITDRNECIKDTSIVLNQPPAFDVQFEVVNAYCPEIADGEIRSYVSGGTTPYTYSWPELGATSANLADVKAGTYTLIVTDAQDCKTSAVTEVGISSDMCLKIPNAFSPNDDGVNDRWEIMVGNPNSAARYYLRDLYPEAIVEIYSANWGICVFRSQKGYPEPWDGKYHGKYLPINSYLYIIRLNSSIKPITGNVTIIR